MPKFFVGKLGQIPNIILIAAKEHLGLYVDKNVGKYLDNINCHQ